MLIFTERFDAWLAAMDSNGLEWAHQSGDLRETLEQFRSQMERWAETTTIEAGWQTWVQLDLPPTA